MKRVDELGALNRFGKWAAPALAQIAAKPAGARILAYLEAYLAVLQGKGSGSGWDLESEAAVAARCIRRVHPVIVDAGANRGAWSSALHTRIAHLQPSYYLLEPSSGCQEALNALAIPYAHPIQVAVGAREEEATLLSDQSGSEAASLYLRRDTFLQSEQPPRAERVTIRTIDALMAELEIPNIDFLKIDVEGHELAVLQGAKRALESASIRALAFEFGSGQINSRTYFHDFWDLLHPLGYRLYRILPGGRTLAISSYYETLEYFRGVSNYLALQPDRLPD